jgi:hypothetical protein
MTAVPVAGVAFRTISDPMEQPNRIRGSVTAALAARLFDLASGIPANGSWVRQSVFRLAHRLSRCADAGLFRTGWRCGASMCPRCARQRAIRNRKRLSLRLGERARAGLAEHGYALLTVSVAASTLESGYRLLLTSWRAYLRTALVNRSVRGGEAHVHTRPARGAEGERWNLHVHAIVELARPLGSTSALTLSRRGRTSRFVEGRTVPSTFVGTRISRRRHSHLLRPNPTIIRQLPTSRAGLSNRGSRTLQPSWRRGSPSTCAVGGWCSPGARGGPGPVSLPPGTLKGGGR